MSNTMCPTDSLWFHQTNPPSVHPSSSPPSSSSPFSHIRILRSYRIHHQTDTNHRILTSLRPTMEPDHKPLLSGNDEKVESWRPYEYHPQPPPTGEDVKKSGPNFSESDNKFSCYPPSLHAALVGSPDPSAPLAYPCASSASNDMKVASDGGYAYQGGYNNNYMSSEPSKQFASHALDEMEIRELLIDHVGHRCCWGSGPARTWQITSIEHCSAHVGTLETFTEEREAVTEREPYYGGEIDGRCKEPQIGVWELDVCADFPQLFVPKKKVRIKIPHSEAVQRCNDCNGRGDTVCPFCHGMMQMSHCSGCGGSGLISDQDGTETICKMCMGRGMQDCASCNSRGTMTCTACNGHGSLLTRTVAVVTWKTLYTKKVSATSIAASVPDKVFHNARGVQLCNTLAYQCTPAVFSDSYDLNNFSSQVIASRVPVPCAARVIMERHIISFLPVTRVIMAHRNRSFSFYIVGYDQDVFVKDYPSRFCWGFCCCFDWLNM